MRENLIIAVIIVLTACVSMSGREAQAAQNASLIKAQVLTIANTQRTYDLYVPQTLTQKPVPLLLLFHGHGGDSDVMTGENHKAAPYKVWLTLADKNQFIIAIPNGTAGADGWLGWNDCRADATTNPHSDDLGFIAALVQQLTHDYPIDSRRIYASGTSNGGHMVLRLAMELSGTFAAVAPVVAAMPLHNKCKQPEHSISVLFMNGTEDPFSPFDGGKMGKDKYERGEVLSTPASVGYWIKHNGVSENPAVKEFPNRSRRDSSRVVRESYADGNQGPEVVLYKVIGGGHTEPSIKEKYGMIYRLIVGNQNHDVEMANEIWEFLQNKRR